MFASQKEEDRDVTSNIFFPNHTRKDDYSVEEKMDENAFSAQRNAFSGSAPHPAVGDELVTNLPLYGMPNSSSADFSLTENGHDLGSLHNRITWKLKCPEPDLDPSPRSSVHSQEQTELDSVQRPIANKQKKINVVKSSRSPIFTKPTEKIKTKLWSEELDQRLREGVDQCKAQGWTVVAQFVGEGMTSAQCKGRWNNYLRPVQEGLNSNTNWTDEEVSQLSELVRPYLIEPTRMNNQEHVDWTAIGNKLGRVPHNCSSKWDSLVARMMLHGPFSAEEDALIHYRVNEWGDRGNGLWVSLQNEMGRSSTSLNSRWRTLRKRFDKEYGDM